jgi:hypothetical protein
VNTSTLEEETNHFEKKGRKEEKREKKRNGLSTRRETLTTLALYFALLPRVSRSDPWDIMDDFSKRT